MTDRIAYFTAWGIFLHMMHSSDNLTDPKQTVRVLTIMLAEEY